MSFPKIKILVIAALFILTVLSCMATAQESYTISPSQFVFLARMGGGQVSAGGQFQYDQVPDGYEDETPYTSSNGYATNWGAEFWWFPASGRSFLLTASVLDQTGYNSLKPDDDKDYGAKAVDKKNMQYNMSNILVGLGYRFLYGERNDFGTNLHLKLGGGGANIVISDLMDARGGNAAVEIGANIFKRFDNDFLIGLQWDIRMWGMWVTETEMKYLNTDADFAYGGGGVFLSVIGGWELI